MIIKVINYEGKVMDVPACKRAEEHSFRFAEASGIFEARYSCAHCHMMLQAKYVE